MFIPNTGNMHIYRVAKTKWAKDTSGEGARLYGGRWNHKKLACIYASESRALAMLEYTVNINVDDIPLSLTLVTLEIDDAVVLSHEISQLPGNWKEYPAPVNTKDMGSAWLREGKKIIRIPSVVIPQEFNFIINGQIDNSTFCKIVHVEDLEYDLRIKS
ncbi:MAG: RES family NAD+ phosphorylase [Ferruginibacter sp.]